jgi:hypothetical protein
MFAFIGCGRSGTAVLPVNPEQGSGVSLLAPHEVQSNRYLWGMWDMSIDPATLSAEVVPRRAVDFHLNATKMLETSCSDCLKINNIKLIAPKEISVDVTLRHPFPGNLNLTAFDVRGIFISNGTDQYWNMGGSLAWGDEFPQMANYDGYTRLYAPDLYPESDPTPPAFKYYSGKYSTTNDLSAWLNPFVAYSKSEPRRMFLPGTQETRTIILKVPTGPFDFGYAVDACWANPGKVVTDPEVDFPLSANSIEPYEISISVEDTMDTWTGSTAYFSGVIYDHQPISTIDIPPISPRVNTMAIEGKVTEWNQLTYNSVYFAGYLQNEWGIPEGKYPLEVLVSDNLEDHPISDFAWQITTLEIHPLGKHDPIAKAAAYPTLQIVGKTVEFYDDGSYDPDGGDLAKYEWDWDNDGTYDYVGKQGTHAFDAPGVHEVQLRVTDDEGKTGILPEPLQIEVKTGQGWARTWGSYNIDIAKDVCVDSQGNVYVVGAVQGTTDYDPGPGVEERKLDPGFLGLDAYLSKFDQDGSFLWVRSIHGWELQNVRGVALDASGDVYVTGYFYYELTFEGDPSGKIYEGQDYSGYIAKYDSEGIFQWAKTWGPEPDTADFGIYVMGLDTDPAGNLYVVGLFDGIVDFDPGPGVEIHEPNSEYYQDGFAVKFDSAGNFAWAGTWALDDEFRGIWDVAADSVSGFYVTGDFDEPLDFDPGDGVSIVSPLSPGTAFLVKLDANCDFQWVRAWGAQSGIALDSDGDNNIYVGGYFVSTVDFDPGPGVDEHVASAYNSYVSKFDSSGQFLWARTWGSDYSGGPEEQSVRAIGIAADSLYVGGEFYLTVDFDPGPGVDEHQGSSWGDSDAYLSKFDLDGQFQWARTWGSGGDNDYQNECVNGVAVGPSDFAYAVGYFFEPDVDFDPGPGFDWHASVGKQDCFLTAFPPDGTW